MRDIERRIKALEATAARREAARANIQSVNVCDHIAPVYLPLHADLQANAHQYYNLPGGRGSAKSSFVSLEIVAGIMQDQTGCSNCRLAKRGLKGHSLPQIPRLRPLSYQMATK